MVKQFVLRDERAASQLKFTKQMFLQSSRSSERKRTAVSKIF